VDFTPFLRQLRIDHALAASQLSQMSQVYCLGSRLLLSAVVRAAPRPEGILGAVTTAEEGLAKVVRHQPDLLVVSEGLERGCGVELTLQVKRDHPRTRVLLLVSRKASCSRAREAIAAGCDGVLRDAGLGAGGELAAIRTICHGGQVIDRSLEDLWRRQVDTIPRLSHRELQVLAGVARGDKNQEIAKRLILSVDTVKTHISRLLVKLSARDRTHAAVRALQLGLLDWP
jgi:DNA-binding NarL/FixJ family response regulator